ncbi:MAG: carboxypeptidase-like regulatory domain-containing protein, partial [Gemmatimonadota bacterium]
MPAHTVPATCSYLAQRTWTLVCVLAWLVASPFAADAQASSLHGTVVQEDGQPVPYASVSISGFQRTVIADQAGTFRFPDLDAGEYRLLASAQGYGTGEVGVTQPVPRPVRIVLRPDPVALEALTVTGTMQRSSVAESSVKVEVVPARVLQRTATNNLTEAIQYVNGLYTQVDCGVCYTNNIRINGMEGP